MKQQKPTQLTKIDLSEVQNVIIKDYRTPSSHYGYLKNQIINSKYYNKNNSSLRQSLTDSHESKLSYL